MFSSTRSARHSAMSPIGFLQKGCPCVRDVGGGLRSACGIVQIFSGRLDIGARLNGTAFQVAAQNHSSFIYGPVRNVEKFHPSFLEGHWLSGQVDAPPPCIGEDSHFHALRKGVIEQLFSPLLKSPRLLHLDKNSGLAIKAKGIIDPAAAWRGVFSHDFRRIVDIPAELAENGHDGLSAEGGFAGKRPLIQVAKNFFQRFLHGFVPSDVVCPQRITARFLSQRQF